MRTKVHEIWHEQASDGGSQLACPLLAQLNVLAGWWVQHQISMALEGMLRSLHLFLKNRMQLGTFLQAQGEVGRLQLPYPSGLLYFVLLAVPSGVLSQGTARPRAPPL